jgi:hypothetical protein
MLRMLWRCPAPGHLHPFGQTATLLALNLRNIRVAATPASDAVLLLTVPMFPIVVFLAPLFFVVRGHF